MARTISSRYRDAEGRSTRRTVRPLGMWFWGKVWTLVAWCELRDDFRMLRVDRMGELEAGAKFREEKGRTLLEFFKNCEVEPPM